MHLVLFPYEYKTGEFMRVWLFISLSLAVTNGAQSETFNGFTENTQITTFDGLKLSAKIEHPSSKVQGAVLILQGSGNVGSDGDVSSPILGAGFRGQAAKLSDQIAEKLSASDFASIRYAKRGFEDANELANHQTIPYLEKDAESALALLQSKFSSVKVGIVGFSEGSTLATLVADHLAVDSLFLLSLPTRFIDDIFHYQFVDWPVRLLVSHFDPKNMGFIASGNFLTAHHISPPLLPTTPWSSVNTILTQPTSETETLTPFYEKYYASQRTMLETPAFKAWYEAYQAVPTFSVVASQIKTKSIFIYQSEADAQLNPRWVGQDAHLLPVKYQIKYFPGVGHCFSPMSGPIGEGKTSGPLSQTLLSALNIDVVQGLK
jgi:hypothetical protein